MLTIGIVTNDEAPITRETRTEIAIQLRKLASVFEAEDFSHSDNRETPILTNYGEDIGQWYLSNPVPIT